MTHLSSSTSHHDRDAWQCHPQKRWFSRSYAFPSYKPKYQIWLAACPVAADGERFGVDKSIKRPKMKISFHYENTEPLHARRASKSRIEYCQLVTIYGVPCWSQRKLEDQIILFDNITQFTSTSNHTKDKHKMNFPARLNPGSNTPHSKLRNPHGPLISLIRHNILIISQLYPLWLSHKLLLF